MRTIDSNEMVPGTDFDAGIGERVFADHGQGIVTTAPIDFDNDGVSDLLIAHHDSSVRLLKSYGGDMPYHDM